ncbi:MAG: T9SS C-terminal target domain-containing protein [Bacteroidetes bacterium]|nr:T9SS C-terminal target domain-containing protein [Bacteroidota bacterium]
MKTAGFVSGVAFTFLSIVSGSLVWAQSAVVSGPSGQIEMGVEETHFITIAPGENPTETLDPASITAFQFQISVFRSTANPSDLEVSGFTTENTVVEGWTIETNLISSSGSQDVYLVAAASSEGMTGFGKLLGLTMRGDSPGTASFYLNDVVLNRGDQFVRSVSGTMQVVEPIPISFTSTGIALAETGTLTVEVPSEGPDRGVSAFMTVANANGPINPPDQAAYAVGTGFPLVSGLDRPSGNQQVSGANWIVNAGFADGTLSSFYDRAFRTGWSNVLPDDYEIRFTDACYTAWRTAHDSDNATEADGQFAAQLPRNPSVSDGNCYAYDRFGYGPTGTDLDDLIGARLYVVPFEVWNTGSGTPDDPADDVQLIPAIIDWDGNGFSLSTTDNAISDGSDDPELDWMYMYRPGDGEATGSEGYQAWLSTLISTCYGEAPADGCLAEAHGFEVMARMTLVGLDLGDPTSDVSPIADMPEAGTIIRIETTKPDPNSGTYASTALADRGVVSLEMEVFFDPDVLQVEDVTLEGTLFEGGMVSYHEINPGRLLVALATMDPLPANGPLFNVKMLGRSIGSSNVNARNVRFNNAPYGTADIRVAGVAVAGGTTPVVSMTRAQVSPGNPVSLGVALYNPNATPVTSFDATYTYDSAIVSFNGVDATGKALDGFAFEVVPVGDGQGKSSLVSVVVKGSGEARTPNGELYDLSFEAIDFGAIAVTPSSIVVNDDPNLVGGVVSAPVEVVDQSQLSIGFSAFSAMGRDESIEVSWMTAPGIEHLSSVVHVRHLQSGETRRFVVPPSGSARITPEFVGELAISLEAVRADGQLDWSDEVIVSTFDDTPLQLLAPYPNPARGNIRSAITVATTQDVRVVLFDMLGREVQEVYQGTLQANDYRSIEVQRAGLTPGVYFLRLSGATHSAVKQLVIQ